MTDEELEAIKLPPCRYCGGRRSVLSANVCDSDSVGVEDEKMTDNKCGDCAFLITEDGEPYYCAIRDLYTCRKVDDAACEYWKGGGSYDNKMEKHICKYHG